jgi:hypothetical protein
VRGVESAVRVLEHALELAAQTIARDRTEAAVAQCAAQRAARAGRQREAEPRRKPRSAQRARRVVVEAVLVEDPQPPRGEVGRAVERVDELRMARARGARERQRECVDAEVAPREVLREVARTHGRQRAGMRIALAAHGREVDRGLADLEHRGAEAVVARQPARAAGGARRQRARARGVGILDQEIHVDERAPEQEVAHRAADQQYRDRVRIRGAQHRAHEVRGRGRQAGERGVRPGLAAHRPPEPRGCRRSTVSRSRARETCV